MDGVASCSSRSTVRSRWPASTAFPGRFGYGIPSEEDNGVVYDSVGAAMVMCSVIVNVEFPSLGDGRTCDGLPVRPGMKIGILSSDPGAVEDARLSLAKLGLSLRPLERREIPGPAAKFVFNFVEVIPPSPRLAGR